MNKPKLITDLSITIGLAFVAVTIIMGIASVKYPQFYYFTQISLTLAFISLMIGLLTILFFHEKHPEVIRQ